MPRPPVQTSDLYTVVENAGYEREADQRSFDTYRAAYDWSRKQYSAAELDNCEPESLHVSIRLDKANGEQTYDF